MENEEFEDLTMLFLRLQKELEPAGVGRETSLDAQLGVIESDLGHLFVNSNHLSSCLGAGGLTYEHAFLKRTEEWSSSCLSKLLEEYRSAQAIDKDRLFSVLASFQPRMDSAYEQVVSIASLEADKANLKPQVFTKSCLRDMGDMIESSLLPFIRLRLKVLEIGELNDAGKRRIDDLSLGHAIAELKSADPTLYSPAPFNISLSQWRNISHHSSYRLRGDTVCCEYGNKRPRKQFECSTTQLLEMFRYVDNVYYLHKVAFEFFCTDNISALAQAVDTSSTKSELSEFTTDATMAYSVAASGFRILNAARKDIRWMFALQDLHGRSKKNVELALQEALIPYLLHKGPTQMNAQVESSGEQHFVSFVGELRSSSDELKDGERGAFKIGKNFRIEQSSE